ncbi:MAG: TraR/DksA C4-type zinc finger protein [Gammaproteobacteria bacterium]
MADEADIANEAMTLSISRALDKMRQESAGKPGPRHCKECGENIPEPRRKLGFKLCIECAEEFERRQSQYADY